MINFKKVMEMRIEKALSSFEELEAVMREIVSKWREPKTVLLSATSQHLDTNIKERMFLLWVWGNNLSSTEETPPASLKWYRSILFLSSHRELRVAVEDRFTEVVGRPEESKMSLFRMPFSLVDAHLLDDPQYAFIHNCGCPIIAVVNEPLPTREIKADYLIVFNPAVFYTVPVDWGDKVFPITFPMFHIWEFNLLPQWDERGELAILLVPSLLKETTLEGITRSLSKFKIPVLSSPEGAENYRFVLLPTSLDVHQLYCPPVALEVLKKGCYLVTNNGLALHYPTAIGGLHILSEAEVIPALLSAYEEEEEKISAERRLSDMFSLLENYTYEGFLYYLVTLLGKGAVWE